MRLPTPREPLCSMNHTRSRSSRHVSMKWFLVPSVPRWTSVLDWTGTHVVQICLFLLTESRDIPGRLIQTSPPRRRRDGGPGTCTIIDLDLSKYDRLASRFHPAQREGLSFLKSGLDTRNAAFHRLIERIRQVPSAPTAPLLPTGPPR